MLLISIISLICILFSNETNSYDVEIAKIEAQATIMEEQAEQEKELRRFTNQKEMYFLA